MIEFLKFQFENNKTKTRSFVIRSVKNCTKIKEMTSKGMDRSGKMKFFHTKGAKQRQLRSSGLKSSVRGKKGVVNMKKSTFSATKGEAPTPRDDIYEFVYDADSEPKIKKKTSKNVCQKRVHQKNSVPKIKSSKNQAKTSPKTTTKGAVFLPRSKLHTRDNALSGSAEDAAVLETQNSIKNQKKDPTEDRQLVQTRNALKNRENAISKRTGDTSTSYILNEVEKKTSQQAKQPNKSDVQNTNIFKNQENSSASKPSWDMIVSGLPNKERKRAPQNETVNTAFIQTRNASKKVANTLPEQCPKGAISETPSPLKRQNRPFPKLTLASAVLKTSNSLGNDKLNTPIPNRVQNCVPEFAVPKHFEKQGAPLRLQEVVNSSTPLPRNKTTTQKTSFSMLSPWRFEESLFDLGPIFSPLQSDLSKRSNVDPETHAVAYQDVREPIKDVGTVLRELSNVPQLKKRLRLSLSKSFKVPKANNQATQNDLLNFGFEEEEDSLGSDKCSEILPNKETLNMLRTKVRESFSKSTGKHDRSGAKAISNCENVVTLYPHLPLFYDPMETKSDEEDLTEERDIRYMLRKPRVNRCLSLSDSDEESVQLTTKKKNRTGERNVQLESFAKEFNSMCEEVEQYELIVEPTRN